jgi:hypothetical protein
MKLTMLGVLGLLVVVGTLLLRKQPRSRGQSSLITRSMSKRKPRR